MLLVAYSKEHFKEDTRLLLPVRIVKERIWFHFYQKKSGFFYGGDNRARTGNLRRARAALSQLSYIPKPVRSFRKTWWA